MHEKLNYKSNSNVSETFWISWNTNLISLFSKLYLGQLAIPIIQNSLIPLRLSKLWNLNSTWENLIIYTKLIILTKFDNCDKCCTYEIVWNSNYFEFISLEKTTKSSIFCNKSSKMWFVTNILSKISLEKALTFEWIFIQGWKAFFFFLKWAELEKSRD
jgi:hypothetical protein